MSDCRTIELNNGYVTTIDVEDYARVSQFQWTAWISYRKDGSIRAVYALRSIQRPDGTWTQEKLHRVILGINDPSIQVDHHDSDGLNNRRSNLRVCTNRQNTQNVRKPVTNTSGFKGVTWDKENEKWIAQLSVSGKHKNLGRFTDPKEAAAAYNAAALLHFGEFARLNDL